MTYRTLGEMRSILLARLGFGGMGASGGANTTNIDSFLQNGQAQLYRLQDWQHLTDYKDYLTGVAQNLYDYPTSGVMGGIGCPRDKRILRIECQISGQFVQLNEDITTEMWSTMDTQSYPVRYERLQQILVYPKADAQYTLRVWFISDLAPFTETDHRASLDDEMIMLHALATGKAHYRQPDASIFQGQLNTMLASLRGQSFGSNGVFRRGQPRISEVKPRLLGRDA